jgi:cation diffusion facilitator CzcD-associated flavoprotein CzcO
VNVIETKTLIIGASISGLASAAALKKKGIEFIILEKQASIAYPWHHHYERLHLHTNKRVSSLPYKKFSNKIPRYPSRQQVLDYLEAYRKEFQIGPLFDTEAIHVKKEGDFWCTQTQKGIFKSNYLIMATGAYSKPRVVDFKGMGGFPGRILHSFDYISGKEFKDQRVLVVGFGNSACEIAMDLFEQGAFPGMSIRSPVNVVPRDIFGIPILEISILLNGLSPRLADTISAPLIRVLIGDLGKLGLKKMPYGVLEEIRKDGNAPVLDIGTVKLIRQGHIKIFEDIDQIVGNEIYFKDGKHSVFDAIIAGIGYYRDYAKFLHVDQSRFEDLKLPTDRQRLFGKDGLYFCGYWVSPTGQIREIRMDALRIAKDITKKENQRIKLESGPI